MAQSSPIGSPVTCPTDGSAARSITLNFGSFKPSFTSDEYLLSFALPNFFFHVSMAYAILRHNGVDVGKRDFLGRLRMNFVRLAVGDRVTVKCSPYDLSKGCIAFEDEK